MNPPKYAGLSFAQHTHTHTAQEKGIFLLGIEQCLILKKQSFILVCTSKKCVEQRSACGSLKAMEKGGNIYVYR